MAADREDAVVVQLPGNAEGLTAFCIRCGAEFRRTMQPGRRPVYCTPTCRDDGYRELRTARSRLAHFESVVEELRAKVHYLERGSDDGEALERDRYEQRVAAQVALGRAEGALTAWEDSEDARVAELRHLVEAVSPLVR